MNGDVAPCDFADGKTGEDIILREWSKPSIIKIPFVGFSLLEATPRSI